LNGSVSAIDNIHSSAYDVNSSSVVDDCSSAIDYEDSSGVNDDWQW
jgi:hypothetical protein